MRVYINIKVVSSPLRYLAERFQGCSTEIRVKLCFNHNQSRFFLYSFSDFVVSVSYQANSLYAFFPRCDAIIARCSPTWKLNWCKSIINILLFGIWQKKSRKTGGHRVKYGLDHILDHFLDHFLDYFLDHFFGLFFGPFFGPFYRGEAYH